MTITRENQSTDTFLNLLGSLGEKEADRYMNEEPTPIQAYPIDLVKTTDRWGRQHQAVSAMVHQKDKKDKSATWHQASISPFTPGVPYSTEFREQVQRTWNALFQGVTRDVLRRIDLLTVVQVTRIKGGLHLKTTLADMQRALETARAVS